MVPPQKEHNAISGMPRKERATIGPGGDKAAPTRLTLRDSFSCILDRCKRATHCLSVSESSHLGSHGYYPPWIT